MPMWPPQSDLAWSYVFVRTLGSYQEMLLRVGSTRKEIITGKELLGLPQWEPGSYKTVMEKFMIINYKDFHAAFLIPVW